MSNITIDINTSPLPPGSFLFVLVVLAAPMVGLTLLLLLWYVVKYSIEYNVYRYRKWRHSHRGPSSEKSLRGMQVPRTQLTARERVAVFLSTSWFGKGWALFQALLSVAAFALYVISLYTPSYSLFLAELAIVCLFLVDYFLNGYLTRNKLLWIWSANGIIDIVTIVPVFAELATNPANQDGLGLSFLRALRVLRILRVARLVPVSSFASGVIQRALIQLFIWVVCILLICAGIMQSIEAQVRPGGMNYHTAIYWMTVTLSTTGYGDIVPTTEGSRGALTIIIFVVFPLVGLQTARLIELQSLYDKHKGAMQSTPQRIHMVIVGDMNYSTVLIMLREIFHKVRPNRNISVVLLSTQTPSPGLKVLLSSPFYSSRVEYLLGSALNSK